MNIIFVIMIILLFLLFLICFLSKNDIFCDNLKSLKDLKSNPEVKIKYIKLKSSVTFFDIKHTIFKRHKLICFEDYLYKNKDYLFTISKFIDFKINKDKKKYRAKNKLTLIENLAFVSTQTIYSSSYSIFKTYKNNYNYFSIKNKEHRMFKFLVGKFLLNELCKIESEVIKISIIINKYKKRNFIINYNKNIYNTAKFYSILKYNQNSTKILYSKNINKTAIVQNLFSEMSDASRKFQTIISYLKVMFWDFHFTF